MVIGKGDFPLYPQQVRLLETRRLLEPQSSRLTAVREKVLLHPPSPSQVSGNDISAALGELPQERQQSAGEREVKDQSSSAH